MLRSREISVEMKSRMVRSVLTPRRAFLRGRADAEELIEGVARIANHRQRRFGVGPADGVGVDAGIAIGTAARLIDVLDRQLHRGDGGVLPELLGVELIDRGTDVHIGPSVCFGCAWVRNTALDRK